VNFFVVVIVLTDSIFQYMNPPCFSFVLYFVNGKIIAKALPFIATGSWVNWKSISIDALLKAGLNEIRLESTGASGPNVDHLNIKLK